MESTAKPSFSSNIINVSAGRPFSFYVFLAKKYLEQFETIQLHALVHAISVSAMAAENLKRNGYVTIKKIECKEVEVKSSVTGSLAKRAKMMMELEKTPNFDKLVEEFNALKNATQEENIQERDK